MIEVVGKKPKNPCYSEVLNVDCPYRSTGCAVNCTDWKKFQVEQEEYRQKLSNAKHRTFDGIQYEKEIHRKLRRIVNATD